MIQTPRTASSCQASILAALQATGITNTSPGAKARAFTDATGDLVSPSFRNQKHLARAPGRSHIHDPARHRPGSLGRIPLEVAP